MIRGTIWTIIPGILIVVSLTAGLSNADTIIVDDDGGQWADHSTITDALENATAGDVIRVYDGNYTESVDIDVPISLLGNSSRRTWIIGDPWDPTVTINSEGVEVSRFRLKDSGSFSGAIKVNSDDAVITYNYIVDSYYGIYCSNSDGLLILNNSVDECEDDGIYIYRGDDLIVKNNSVYRAGDIGINIYDSEDSEIIGNFAFDSNRSGIYASYMTDCSIRDNIIYNNDESGIQLVSTDDSIVRSNECVNNGAFGVSLNFSDENEVLFNYCKGNEFNWVGECAFSINDLVTA